MTGLASHPTPVVAVWLLSEQQQPSNVDASILLLRPNIAKVYSLMTSRPRALPRRRLTLLLPLSLSVEAQIVCLDKMLHTHPCCCVDGGNLSYAWGTLRTMERVFAASAAVGGHY